MTPQLAIIILTVIVTVLIAIDIYILIRLSRLEYKVEMNDSNVIASFKFVQQDLGTLKHDSNSAHIRLWDNIDEVKNKFEEAAEQIFRINEFISEADTFFNSNQEFKNFNEANAKYDKVLDNYHLVMSKLNNIQTNMDNLNGKLDFLQKQINAMD